MSPEIIHKLRKITEKLPSWVSIQEVHTNGIDYVVISPMCPISGNQRKKRQSIFAEACETAGLPVISRNGAIFTQVTKKEIQETQL